MGSVKGQLGIESLLLYGFIIVILGVIIIYLSNIGLFSIFEKTCGETTYGFSVLGVDDYAVYSYDTVQLSIRNMGSSVVNVTEGNVTVGGAIKCTRNVDPEEVIEPGKTYLITIPCNDDPKVSDTYSKGSCYSAEVVLSFEEGNRARQSNGKITGKVA